MRGVTCGLWPSRRGLAAVAVGADGRTIWTATADRDDDAEWDLLSRMDAEVGLDCALVLPDWLGREAIARFALDRGVVLWLAPQALVESVRIVGRLGAGPPARIAAALACLPLAPVLRPMLRRSAPPDARQLSMLP